MLNAPTLSAVSLLLGSLSILLQPQIALVSANSAATQLDAPLNLRSRNLNNKSNDASDQLDTNSNDDDVSVSVIAILSAQRSASTFLSWEIMKTMPCHVALNEPLFKDEGQSGDAWQVEAVDLGFADQPNARGVDPEILTDFILQVGKRWCKDMLEANETLADQCHNHCYVNYKHFTGHLEMWQHQMVWDSLIQRVPFSIAILERNVNDRWKSKQFAKQSGDWDVWGSKDHKERLQEARQQLPPVSEKFWFQHKQWYEHVRGYAKITNKRNEERGKPLVPILELGFDDVTKHPVEETQQLIRHNLMDV